MRSCRLDMHTRALCKGVTCCCCMLLAERHTGRQAYLEASLTLWQVAVSVHPVEAVHMHTGLAQAFATSAALESNLLCHIHTMHCRTCFNKGKVEVVTVVSHHDAWLHLSACHPKSDSITYLRRPAMYVGQEDPGLPCHVDVTAGLYDQATSWTCYLHEQARCSAEDSLTSRM